MRGSSPAQGASPEGVSSSTRATALDSPPTGACSPRTPAWHSARARGARCAVGLEGTRRESGDRGGRAEHGIGVSAGWRLAGSDSGGHALEVRLEASRRDVAGDGDRAREHALGLNLTASW